MQAVITFKVINRQKFFRHDSNSSCEGGQESALHQLGKQILMEARSLEIPNFGRFEYQDAKSEQTIEGTQMHSDVYLTSNERAVHVEILVKPRWREISEAYLVSDILSAVPTTSSSIFKTVETLARPKF